MATAPYEIPEDPNRFQSLEEVEPDSKAWAYARGSWRNVRIVRVAGSRVEVAFRLSGAGVIRTQLLTLNRLRRMSPPRGAFSVVDVPPPAGRSW